MLDIHGESLPEVTHSHRIALLEVVIRRQRILVKTILSTYIVLYAHLVQLWVSRPSSSHFSDPLSHNTRPQDMDTV